MRQARRVLLNRIVLGSLIGPSMLWAGCGGTPQSGGRAPAAGLDELEAQNRFYQERQKKEQASQKK
jgi:hypothetical protein